MWQELQTTGHMLATMRMQTGINTGAQLLLSFLFTPQIPAYVMVPLIGACIPVTINSLYERLTNVFRDMCDRESELLQIDKINNHTHKKMFFPHPTPTFKTVSFQKYN